MLHFLYALQLKLMAKRRCYVTLMRHIYTADSESPTICCSPYDALLYQDICLLDEPKWQNVILCYLFKAVSFGQHCCKGNYTDHCCVPYSDVITNILVSFNKQTN